MQYAVNLEQLPQTVQFLVTGRGVQAQGVRQNEKCVFVVEALCDGGQTPPDINVSVEAPAARMST